jgi:hypothetical protein
MFRGGALARATRRNNPEDTILHGHRRENLKSYTALIFFFLYVLPHIGHRTLGYEPEEKIKNGKRLDGICEEKIILQ